MIEIQGKFGEAKIFTDNVEPEAITDIYKVLNSPVAINSNMRIMPDVHKGASFPIGTTMKITDKVIPNGVSVDIGCGVIVQKLENKTVNLEKLDNIMHNIVPSGFNINHKLHRFANQIDLTKLKCYQYLKDPYKLLLGIGSLGSGNHYCELNKDDEENIYLVIHTGSRNLGKQIAEYYQNEAYKSLSDVGSKKKELIAKLKAEGRTKDINVELAKIKPVEVEKALAYCEGKLMEDYLYDMRIAQEYAGLNRKAIADTIQCGMRWNILEEFETVHNYIDLDAMILRKGAVSAKKGEILYIPMNMSWGGVIAIGKGNPDYNESCSHGSGRKMSRKTAKEIVSMDDYKNSMKGIYSTCINEKTIDESPMAYKDPEEVLENLKDTIEVVKRIVPVYNFKASEEDKFRKK